MTCDSCFYHYATTNLTRRSLVTNQFNSIITEQFLTDRITLFVQSANAVRHQLSDLSRKIDSLVQLVYVSKKIKGHFKPKEHVGFTSRHLHQHVEENKWSTIGYHVKDKQGGDPDSIGSNFEILRKYGNKLDCLIFEMLFIRNLKPKLNKQSDSICVKLFT